jgi:hypothetical protein
MLALRVTTLLLLLGWTHSFAPSLLSSTRTSILGSAGRRHVGRVEAGTRSHRSPTLPSFHSRPRSAGAAGLSCSAAGAPPAAEVKLLELVQATKGRGQSASAGQLQAIQAAIAELEEMGGERDPVASPLISGSWELLYTSKSAFDVRNPLGKRVDGSKPGLEGFFGAIFGGESEATKALTDAASSSPIQRTVTSIDGLLVSQDIVLDGSEPRVDQRVTFRGDAYLRLSASASTSSDSMSRINFTFDLAYFQFGPLRIPYPVPFRFSAICTGSPALAKQTEGPVAVVKPCPADKSCGAVESARTASSALAPWPGM